MSIIISFIVLGVSAFASANDIYEFTHKEYSIRHVEYDNHQEVIYNGQIGPMTSKEGTNNVIKRLVKGKNVLLYIGHSYGGYEATYKKLGKAIRQVCEGNRNCQITTFLQSECASACIELFMHGDKRVATSYSRFGFHLKWMIVPNFTVITPEGMVNKYTKRGASRTWFKKNMHIFTDDQVYGTWVDATDLVAARVVNKIAGPSFVDAYRKANR